MPHRSSVAANWRLQKPRYSMTGTKCGSCGKTYFPPRKACVCGGDLKDVRLSGRGKVESFTVIHAAPEGFEDASPYVIGIIKLEEGPAITGHIINDADEIRVGSRVRSVFRKLFEESGGVITYGFKFQVE